MKLKHWASYHYTKRTAKTLGTMTVTKLADYPIGNDTRRCVIKIVTNDDATCGGGLKESRGLLCPHFSIMFPWLLDNGHRFVSKPIIKEDVVDYNGFAIYGDFDAYSAVTGEAVYEIDYKVK